jgi:hypothetical protein
MNDVQWQASVNGPPFSCDNDFIKAGVSSKIQVEAEVNTGGSDALDEGEGGSPESKILFLVDENNKATSSKSYHQME